jgi:hypothetical protein
MQKAFHSLAGNQAAPHIQSNFVEQPRIVSLMQRSDSMDAGVVPTTPSRSVKRPNADRAEIEAEESARAWSNTHLVLSILCKFWSNTSVRFGFPYAAFLAGMWLFKSFP